jgi:hypothetical protein
MAITVGCGWLLVTGGAGGEKLHTKLTTMLRINKIAKMLMMTCARRCERCLDRLAMLQLL